MKDPAFLTIHDMPLSERPRERLMRCGTNSLSTAELIAIILGNGTRGTSVLQLANQLLSHFGGLDNLVDATAAELCQVKGIGQAKALQLQAALGLAKRILKKDVPYRPRIDTPLQAYSLLKDPYSFAKQEHFIVILQDVKSFLISVEVVAIGTLDETLVHPREVFYPAIRHKAASIVIAHNHPSGDPDPSKEDLIVTEQLCRAGRLMSIPVVDHVILGAERYVSLRQQGLKCFND